MSQNLAQFSPRRLNSEILADDIPFLPLSQSPSRAIVTPRSLGDFPDLASPTKLVVHIS